VFTRINRSKLPSRRNSLAETSNSGDDPGAVTLLLVILIAAAVAGLALSVGPTAARRAEKATGAWAWIIYLGLGLGMIFGAMSISYPLLSAFMWTKLTAFILTGTWLLSGRIRRHEPLFPDLRRVAAGSRI
jgi:hypothetical protein